MRGVNFYFSMAMNLTKPYIFKSFILITTMVRNDILSGIKASVLKGETLQQAMMSFYNAGYQKQDIEDAARALQQENQKILEPPAEKKQIMQKVSDYAGNTKKKDGKIITFLLILLVFILITLLLAFLFREKVIEFLNSLF